jgi:hypothetical protein
MLPLDAPTVASNYLLLPTNALDLEWFALLFVQMAILVVLDLISIQTLRQVSKFDCEKFSSYFIFAHFFHLIYFLCL